MRRFLVLLILLLVFSVATQARTILHRYGGGGTAATGGGGNCGVGATANGCVLMAGNTTGSLVDPQGNTWTLGGNYVETDNTCAAIVSSLEHPRAILKKNGANIGATNAVGLFNDGASDGVVYLNECHTGRWDSNQAGPIYKYTSNNSTLDFTTRYGAPAIPSPGTTNWLTVAASAGSTVLNIPSPTDSVYAAAALTVTVDTLPVNGTVVLADGVTPITVGQTLTAGTLSGLKFIANSGTSYSQASHFIYKLTNPFQISVMGSASITVKPNGLWADPPGVGTAVAGNSVIPAITQPSLAGDIVGVRFQNVTTGAYAGGYKTFGHTFLMGTVQPTDVLIDRLNSAYIQKDNKTTYPDGSLKHAILSMHVPSISASPANCFNTSPENCNHVDAMLQICTSACPAAPTAAPTTAGIITLLAGANDVTDAFTNAKDGNTGVALVPASDTASARTCLTTPDHSSQWLSGPVVNEYDVVCTYLGSNLRVEFDIRAYSDSTTWVDVIHNNAWANIGGKHDLQYDYTIAQNGLTYYTQTAMKQWLYSYVDREVPGTTLYADNPNIQFDVPYWQRTGTFLNYDWSQGVQIGTAGGTYQTIEERYNSDTANAACLALVGSCDMVQDMGLFGFRAEIAPDPNWVAQWANSQNPHARVIMMLQTHGIESIPWHYIDETTVNAPVNMGSNPTFSPANGTPCAPSPAGSNNCSNSNPWNIASNHMPNAAYVPYLITGKHAYLTLQQNQVITAEFGTDLSQGGGYKFPANDTQRIQSSDLYGVRKQGAVGFTYINVLGGTTFDVNMRQPRSRAWETRSAADAADATPDTDPSKTWITNAAADSFAAHVQDWVANDVQMANGIVKGNPGSTLGTFLQLEDCPNHYNTMESDFQLSYLGFSYAKAAMHGLPQGISANAERMAKFMQQYKSGALINGPNGFPPPNASPYHTWTSPPGAATTGGNCGTGPGIGGSYLPWTSWGTSGLMNPIEQYPTADSNVGGAPCAGNATNPGLCPAAQTIFINQNPLAAGGFANETMANLAQMYSLNPSEDTLQAYAFSISYMRYEWANGIGTGETFGNGPPIWPMMWFDLRMPNGSRLSQNESQFVNGAGPLSLTCSTSPCLLGAVISNGSSTTTLTSTNATSAAPDIFTAIDKAHGNAAGSFTITASTNAVDSHQYGSCAIGTFIAGGGSDIFSIGGNCWNGAASAATVQFGTNTTSKTKQIGYVALNGQIIGAFRPGTDTLKVKSTLNGRSYISVADFTSHCSVTGGDTVCDLGAGSVATFKGVTLSLNDSVTIF